ncbi:MAG: helix-turn-helix domain-containing protein [Clostridiaceae bacterium]
MNQHTTYTVTDIQKILRISRSSIYLMMKEPPFPIIRIGKSIRVVKEVFDNWLMCQ